MQFLYCFKSFVIDKSLENVHLFLVKATDIAFFNIFFKGRSILFNLIQSFYRHQDKLTVAFMSIK